MSAKWMGYFFDDTELEGSTLLLALAIADHADNEGVAWPGVKRLAAKIRLGERRTKGLIRELVESGHLEISRQPGRGHHAVLQLKRVQAVTPIKAERVSESAPIRKGEKVHGMTPIKEKGCNPESEKGAISGQERVQSESSVYINHQEPPMNTQEGVCADGSDKVQFISRSPFPLTTASKPLDDPAWESFRDEVQDWYCQTLGVTSLFRKDLQETTELLTWLFENKFTLDDIQGFYGFAKAEKWRQGQVTLSAIVKGIAAWREERRSQVAGSRVPTYCDSCREHSGMIETGPENERVWIPCDHSKALAA